MAFPLRYLSPTQLRTYATCPLQYRHRYIDRMPAPHAPATLVGVAVHSALEANFRHKKRYREDLPVSDAREVFEDAWEEAVPASEFQDEAENDFDQARAEGLELVDFYLREAAPRVIPHLIEHRFRFSVPGLPVPVVGTVDLVDRQGVVIDHKTSRRPFDPDYLASDMQLMCYAIGYGTFRAGARLQPGKLPAPYFLPDVRVDVLVRTTPPKLQQLVAKYGHAELELFIQSAQAIARGIAAGAFEAFWTLPDARRDPAVCARCRYAARCEASLLKPDDHDREQEEYD